MIDLANQKNGHDNTSVVLTYCSVSPQYPAVLNLGEFSLGSHIYTFNLTTEFTDSTEAVESGELMIPEETEPAAEVSKGDWFKVIVGIVLVLLVLLSSGAALLTAQWLISPDGFKQMRSRFFQREQPSSFPERPESRKP